MYIFYIFHTASTDDVLLRNLAKVWMSKDEFDYNYCFSILTKITINVNKRVITKNSLIKSSINV